MSTLIPRGDQMLPPRSKCATPWCSAIVRTLHCADCNMEYLISIDRGPQAARAVAAAQGRVDAWEPADWRTRHGTALVTT